MALVAREAVALCPEGGRREMEGWREGGRNTSGNPFAVWYVEDGRNVCVGRAADQCRGAGGIEGRTVGSEVRCWQTVSGMGWWRCLTLGVASQIEASAGSALYSI